MRRSLWLTYRAFRVIMNNDMARLVGDQRPDDDDELFCHGLHELTRKEIRVIRGKKSRIPLPRIARIDTKRNQDRSS